MRTSDFRSVDLFDAPLPVLTGSTLPVHRRPGIAWAGNASLLTAVAAAALYSARIPVPLPDLPLFAGLETVALCCGLLPFLRTR